MKIKENLNITKIGERYYILPLDNDGDMFAMNTSSKYIIECLMDGCSPEDIANNIAISSGVNTDIILRDIHNLIEILLDKGIAYE